jgi:hypothetical protein
MITRCNLAVLLFLMLAGETAYGDDPAGRFFARAEAESLHIESVEEKYESIALVAQAMYLTGRREQAEQLIRPFLREREAQRVRRFALAVASAEEGAAGAIQFIQEKFPPEQRSRNYGWIAIWQADDGELAAARETLKLVDDRFMSTLTAEAILTAEVAAGERPLEDLHAAAEGNDSKLWSLLGRTATLKMARGRFIDAENVVEELPPAGRYDLYCLLAGWHRLNGAPDESRRLIRQAEALLDELDLGDRVLAKYRIAGERAIMTDMEDAERLLEAARTDMAELDARALATSDIGQWFWNEMRGIYELPVLLLLSQNEQALEMARDGRYQNEPGMQMIGEMLQPEGIAAIEGFLVHVESGKLRAAVWTGAALAAAEAAGLDEQ